MVELIIVILVVGILALIALPKVKEDHLHEVVDQTVALIRYTQQLAMQDNPYDPADPHWFKKRWTIRFAPCPEGENKFGHLRPLYGFTVFKETTNPGETPRPIFAKDPSNPNAFLYSGYTSHLSRHHYSPCDLSKFNKRLNFSGKGLVCIMVTGFYAKFVDKVVITASNGTSREVSPSTDCPNIPTSSLSLSFDEFGRPHMPTLNRPYGGPVGRCNRAYSGLIREGGGYIFKRFKFVIWGRKQVATTYIEGETGFVHVRYKDVDDTYRFTSYEWDAEGY